MRPRVDEKRKPGFTLRGYIRALFSSLAQWPAGGEGVVRVSDNAIGYRDCVTLPIEARQESRLHRATMIQREKLQANRRIESSGSSIDNERHNLSSLRQRIFI